MESHLRNVALRLRCSKVRLANTLDTTWEEAGQHPAGVENPQEHTLRMEAARRVSAYPPLRAQAQLMSEGLTGAALPSMQVLQKARRAHNTGVSKPQRQTTAKEWLEWVESQQNAPKGSADLRACRLMHTAAWLPWEALQQEPPPCAEGCVLMMSTNQVSLAKKILLHGQNLTGMTTVAIDVTWKVVVEGRGYDQNIAQVRLLPPSFGPSAVHLL